MFLLQVLCHIPLLYDYTPLKAWPYLQQMALTFAVKCFAYVLAPTSQEENMHVHSPPRTVISGIHMTRTHGTCNHQLIQDIHDAFRVPESEKHQCQKVLCGKAKVRFTWP